MQLSETGIDLIVSFEGLRLNPYNDGRGYATVGIGHLLHPSPVTPNDQPINKTEAYLLFQHDSQWAQTAIEHLVDVALNQNQFDALVSWTFNLGAGTLSKSQILALINAGNFAAIPPHWILYNKAGGIVEPGLTRRRAAEIALFTKSV